MANVRDWDIFAAIATMIRTTGSFDEVAISDPPELSGRKASYRAIAVIMPGSGDESAEGFDDPDETQRVRRVSWQLMVIARDKEPEIRDRLAEQLLNSARDAIDDRCIAGQTIVGETHVFKDRYLPAIPPERRLIADGTFSYFIDGQDGHATNT